MSEHAKCSQWREVARKRAAHRWLLEWLQSSLCQCVSKTGPVHYFHSKSERKVTSLSAFQSSWLSSAECDSKAVRWTLTLAWWHLWHTVLLGNRAVDARDDHTFSHALSWLLGNTFSWLNIFFAILSYFAANYLLAQAIIHLTKMLLSNFVHTRPMNYGATSKKSAAKRGCRFCLSTWI